jgi:hypothetical protein
MALVGTAHYRLQLHCIKLIETENIYVEYYGELD